MAQPPRVVLVDGSAILYRAFYAIPAGLQTADGIPTNATYGFATMFRKLLAGKRPEYGAMVFDAPGPTFRVEEFPEYKANRPPMPQELRDQIPWIEKLVAGHRFPMLRYEGYEADDVIGTLTRKAEAAGMEVLIVSGDKDFAQLIGERVKMIDTLRDVTFDIELVRKKWGVRPQQFIDYLALVGDKSDNVPGVPGIGAKGAAGLLERFGDLDSIFEHTEELTPRQRTSLVENREQALVSKKLVTIDCEVPLQESLDDLRLDLAEAADLNEFYRRLEFYSLLARGEGEGEGPQPEARADYQICADLEAVDQLVELVAETGSGAEPVTLLALTGAPSPARGDLVALAIAAGDSAWLVPIDGAGALGEEALERLQPWLGNADLPKISYDAKAAIIGLRRRGIELRGLAGDVLLASFLVEPTKVIPHRLEQIAREYLQLPLPPEKTLVGGGRDQLPLAAVPAEELMPWACRRATAVAELWPVLVEKMDEIGLRGVHDELDLPLSHLLASMEIAGIAVDAEDLRQLGEELSDRLEELESTIHELAGREFNIRSTQQLASVLFEDLGLPVIKRTKSGYSTNAEVLERLSGEHEIARHVLEHRAVQKLINTYTEVLQRERDPKTGRIHATFQQTVGATGRLITTEPDLQRTPVKSAEGRRIRRTFVPYQGWQMIAADWSQIELRLLAHITGDENLRNAFASGDDVHRRTAGELFGCAPKEVTDAQRGVGKLVNFSTIYGQGATALAKIVGVSRKEAQRYIDGYFRAYGGVRHWLDKTIAEAHERGFVTTLLGRRRYIPELGSRSPMDRQAGERIAANTPIQGSAADLCKLAMLAIDRKMRAGSMEARMLLQIHDELVFEAPTAEVDALCTIVNYEMENAYPLDVPLVASVGVGARWGEAK